MNASGGTPVSMPLKAVTSPGIPARPSSSSSASYLAELSCQVADACTPTCLLIESSRTSELTRRVRKRRGKKRRRTDSNADIAASTTDIPISDITADSALMSENITLGTTEQQYENNADLTTTSTTSTTVPGSAVYDQTTTTCAAIYTDSAVVSSRSRLSRRQRRRRSVQQQQLTPPPILRPLQVPHAPLNSTSFLMEEHQLPGSSCCQQYTPFDGDDDFMDRDFDTVYQAAHMQQLTGLQPEQLSQQLQQLEDRHRLLEAELLRRDPDVWVQRLQSRLLQLQKHNQLLIKTQTALRETAERLSFDSTLEEEPQTLTHVPSGSHVQTCFRENSPTSPTDTQTHTVTQTEKHTDLVQH